MASPEAWICAAVNQATSLETFPHFAPDGAALPYLTYKRDSTRREKVLAGEPGGAVSTFSLTIYADTYADVKDFADAVRSAIDDFNGQGDGITIVRVDITDERDADPVFFDGRETAVFIVEQYLTIEWEE